LNYLSAALLPISTPNLVLAKSKGYTNVIVIEPAAPPENKLAAINLYGLTFESYGLSALLTASLIEKFKAYVGKYLTTLAPFPLHKDNGPSSLIHLLKQSATLV
jgi:hypothetical protein